MGIFKDKLALIAQRFRYRFRCAENCGEEFWALYDVSRTGGKCECGAAVVLVETQRRNP